MVVSGCETTTVGPRLRQRKHHERCGDRRDGGADGHRFAPERAFRAGSGRLRFSFLQYLLYSLYRPIFSPPIVRMNTLLHPSRAIAASISDSPDTDGLGVSVDHVWDTFTELVIELLASGVDLAYGGDLRERGFTEVLLELAGRYRRPGQTTVRVTNYLAWPVHIRMSMSDLDNVADSVHHVAHLALVGLNGTRMSVAERRELPSHEPDENDWRSGLTAMRVLMRAETSEGQAASVSGRRIRRLYPRHSGDARSGRSLARSPRLAEAPALRGLLSRRLDERPHGRGKSDAGPNAFHRSGPATRHAGVVPAVLRGRSGL